MFETIKQNYIKFLIVWFLIFLGSFIFLSALGLVPNFDEEKVEKGVQVTPNQEVLESKLANIPASLPRRVVADKVGIDIRVNNPESRSINVLDNSLNTGAVRYPGSGVLNQKTNMLIFGHSSNLPVVRNQNYQAFNKLEKLKVGEDVSIFSDTHEFIYKVTSLEEASAENALVVFESDKREVTLSTCNTFGNLDDRFVVRAELVDVLEI